MTYEKIEPDFNLWWCETHQRRATHWLVRDGMEKEAHCDPRSGGIMLPCKTRVRIKGSDRRRFVVNVENGLGDKAEVSVDVRMDLNPLRYTGPAILKAKRMLPDVKPWRVFGWTEQA